MASNKVNFQSAMEPILNQIYDLINPMPIQGDKEEYCQRLVLMNRLDELERAVNSVEETDFVETKYKG